MPDEDVTKLTDEELDARLKGEQPEETEEKETDESAEAEVSEEKEAEEQQPETQPEQPQEEEPEAKQPEEEQRPPSRREQLRIQQILAKREQAQEQQQPQQSRQDALNYQEALDADPETIKQLEADRQAQGQYQFNQGLEQAKTIQFHTRLELDAPKIESKYKFLDPRDKDNFDPVRAEALNNLYLDAVGYRPADPQSGRPESVQNPDIRYQDFVEAQMEFAEALMQEQKTRSTQNIAKQAANTGLRPDGSSAKRLNLNQPLETMTDEELEAYGNKFGLNPTK